jgi:SAM-dependent methyltransferase
MGASTWIAPRDEADRGNLLGAAMVAAEREGMALDQILEGAEAREEAVDAGRSGSLLIVPESDQVLPDAAEQLALLEQAGAEDWRLLLLSLGADSAAHSGHLIAEFFRAMDAADISSYPQPIPEASLRRRVSVGAESTFRRSGVMHVESFDAALRQSGAPLADAATILDWGAGCGRMTAHMIARAPAARITGADTDAEAIAWVGENLDVAAAVALALSPPSSFDDDAFDTVVGHSVFSHLDIDSQDRWLAELARVTRPGGHIAVSFNGSIALEWHLQHPLVDVPDVIRETFERDGIAVWGGDGWEDEFYDGYHTTFHRHEYVREHWSRWGEVVAIHEGAALPTQDIAVLRIR